MIRYMRSDTPSVLRDRMMVQACGTKLTTERAAANRLPTVPAVRPAAPWGTARAPGGAGPDRRLPS